MHDGGRMRRILIVGATSAIAEATARIFSQRGDSLFLAGRDQERLEAIASDLRIRGCPKVEAYAIDVNDFDAHIPMLEAAERVIGNLDTVLIAHGTLSDQKACQQSVELTIKEINTNALSVIALLTHIANRFEQQRHGTIAVISSVAGDRGRQSNYVYGSAKAMVTAFTSGLRQRLHKAGVSVVTINPGFVDTPMTATFKKGPLWASKETVAKGIERAIIKQKDFVYLPFWWQWIMFVIKGIPERVFKSLPL
jgi:decaprenylphospho-beta-D-erythro-pentofuranosid-2-ulose 2-reductase